MQPVLQKIKETNAFACLECGKCTGICPVARHSEEFSPRSILVRAVRNSHPDAIKRDDLWSCLNCRQCDEICPSDIKYIELTQILRQAVGIGNFSGTCSHGGILQSIGRMMGNADLKQQRMAWLTGDLKTSKNGDTLFFVGCLPYYDALFSDLDVQPAEIARNSLKILNHFGIKPQILADERCCGHDFFWNGDFETFQKLAEKNLQQFEEHGIKKIITACPECYRTLKVDYARYFGGSVPDVIHISSFIANAIKDQPVKKTKNPKLMTYQDPCRLGRHMGVYEAPRRVLENIPAYELKEMAHNGRRAICCGVSGWVNCSSVSKKIQTQRLQEAQATGAEVLVTSCVKCQIHFACALSDQALKNQFSFELKDLTTLVAEYLH